MPKLHDIKDMSPNKALVAVLEKALAEAKAGELRSAVIVKAWADDSVCHAWALDGRTTVRRMLSEIVMMQHDFIVNIEFMENDSILAKAFSETD
jgi:hypothetical protein